MKYIKQFLIPVCLVLISPGCSPRTGCGNAQGANSCLRILFVGNSYTYVNDLPGVFAQLAGAGGHAVEVETDAQGGWSLSDHVNSSATLNQIILSKWNFVVLQEQSEIPSMAQSAAH